ncbi:MAG TPA: DUF2891 domain-containing protein [Gemmatimonadaceae bacterium]|nr:DUF2891 domain-containing protein [Gemmatimonadaceae bacterium]
MIDSSLTPSLASRFARLALSHVTREYPNKLDHVLGKGADLKSPRELHPVFFGSFDWHSCVHGYWLLATVLRLFPEIKEATAIRRLFGAQLTAPKVKGEVRYLERKSSTTFERPYGWAWLLMLAAELSRHDSSQGRKWSDSLRPLTGAFRERFLAFLPKATYPIRVGTHFNSAFAITLALEYSDVSSNSALRKGLATKAKVWFRSDTDCQAWEPGGDDFLSSALMEAECMRRVLGPADFSIWLDCFLPRLAVREPATLFTPAIVSDRSDGKIAHLDGLNLSRAWCWRSIAQSWAVSDARRGIALEAAARHLAASLPHVAGDYMGEHWLATFALLALL